MKTFARHLGKFVAIPSGFNVGLGKKLKQVMSGLILQAKQPFPKSVLHCMSTSRFTGMGWCVAGCIISLLVASVFGTEPDCWQRPVQFGLVTPFSLRHTGTELGNSIKPSGADRTSYLDALQELGIASVRDAVINWAEVQPERDGPYDFGYLDDFMRKASDRGIDVLGLAYFFPPWATIGEDGPRNLLNDGRYSYKLPLRKYEPEFRKFVRTSVGRYCGCQPDSLSLKIPMRYVVFMNETEGYAGEFLNSSEYAYWLRVFSEEVRAVDPGIKVVAPALAAPGAWHGKYFQGEFLDRLLDSKELSGPGWPYFDVVDYHPYPSAYGSSQADIFAIDVATSYVRATLARHGLRMPLWITEVGDNSSDEITQADRTVEYAIHAASVGVERVYVFGMTDYGKDHWGLLRDTPSGQPPAYKPSFVAYKTLLSKILGNQRVDFIGPGRYRVFRKGKPILYVLWTAGESTSVPYFLRGQLRVTDLTGNTRTVDSADLKLGVHPLLVESEF